MKKLLAELLCLSLLVPQHAQAAAKQIHNKKEFRNAVYTMALNRKDSMAFSYSGDYHNVFNGDAEALLASVCSIDRDTPDDCDYLRNCIYSINVNTECSVGKKGEIAGSVLNVKLTYLEDKEQLKQVNQQVAKVMKKLKLNKKSDVKKVKLIHDWIANNCQYVDGLSAYDVFMTGKAVCQGYAGAFYKLATAAGMKCRIIRGKTYSNGTFEWHAWNLVKVDGKWYHLDVTWDDPVGEKDTVIYDFFLRGSAFFDKSHRCDAAYRKIVSKVSTTDWGV